MMASVLYLNIVLVDFNGSYLHNVPIKKYIYIYVRPPN